MLIRTAIALVFLATPALADRMRAEADCAPTGMDMQFTCNISITAGGHPVEGAVFTVSPSMPSMPMAHNIPASPSQAGTTPGVYSVSLHLEMPGDWLLTLDIIQPRRDRVIVHHSFGATAMDHHKTGHSGHDTSD